MLALKKIWVWIKKHWYVPLFVILVALSGIGGLFGLSRNKQLEEMLDANKKSYKDQIRVINESHEKELKKQEELYITFLATMKKLEKEHNINLDSLEKEKKDNLNKMVKKYKGTPKELARELSEMFGVDYVE